MRDTRKTKAMVLALPVSGCVVIVHTGAMKHHLRGMIEDLRGAAVAATIRILLVTNASDAHRSLVGVSRPVFVDHAVWDNASREAKDAVAIYAQRANARHPEMEHLENAA